MGRGGGYGVTNTSTTLSDKSCGECDKKYEYWLVGVVSELGLGLGYGFGFGSGLGYGLVG
jgi:hypothetical protein